MSGRKLINKFAELGLGTDESRSANIEHLFDTPLGPTLKALTKILTADNMVDLDERRAWLRMKERGEDMDEENCDRVLQLRREDTIGDVTDEDIAELEEQLRQQEEMSQMLDAELARLDAKLAVINDEEETDKSDLLDSNRDIVSDSVKVGLEDVAATFSKISISSRSIGDSLFSSTALPLLDTRRYAEAEDEFRAGLTSLSKQLLASRMTLLNAVFNPPEEHADDRKGDVLAMRDRYRCSLKKLILAKLELLLLESLPNAKMREALGSQLSTDPEFQTTIGKLSEALDCAADSFVSDKVGPDLDLQLARLNFFIETKRQILDHLMDQWCRQIAFCDLWNGDAILHEELSHFLKDVKEFSRRLASERATMQRSLDVVSGFSNAPDSNRHSRHFSNALEAVKRLVIGQLPPLVSAAREEAPSDDTRQRGADSTATTDDEVVKILQLEWQKRESRCLSDASTWDDELKTFGRELLRVRDSVAEESSSLEDPQLTVELDRLQRQYQMASKNVQHAVDVEAREGRPINKAVKLLKKAPSRFHTKPDKFRELVQILQDSLNVKVS